MAYEFNDNIQRGILYLLKTKRDFYLQIINLVKPEYFEFPSHSKIFEAVNEYYSKYQKLPSDSFILEDVKNKLAPKEELFDYEDELNYINSLDTSAIDNPDYYMDLVERFAKNESMKQAIQQGITLLKDNRVEEIEEIVRNALTVRRTVDVGQNYFEDLSERWDRVFNIEFKERYKTIFPTLDKSLDGGLSRKELAMVVAPPGVGKSIYLVNQGVKSLTEGRQVLYISLEMSEDKIAQRFDSISTLIPQRELKRPETQLKVKERLDLFADRFSGAKLIIKEFPTGTATINTIRSLLVQLRNHEDFEPDLIIVDYMELMRPIRETLQEYQAQQKIAEEMRGLAMEYKCLIWTATQTNRQGRSVKLITDSELGDSYGKIRTCDFAVSLNQTEEELDNERMRVYVIKSRNGPTRFVVPAHVDYSTLTIKETDGLD